jgi:hypothetical protein
MSRLESVAATPIRPPGGPEGVRPGHGRPSVDTFGRVAGPDAVIDGDVGLVRVYAIFSFDPESNEIHVRIVDEQGRLIRTIPPATVAQMLAAMGAYAGR